MELETRNMLAALLRNAAGRTISETEFWTELRAVLNNNTKDPIVQLAWESATHYWGNFHRKSIFFFIPLKPNRGQLEQGKNELNLIADGLEAGWEFPVLAAKLKDI